MEWQTRCGLIVMFAVALLVAILCWCAPPPAQAQSVDLIWTAPGDDGDVGRATAYDLRYSRTAVGTDTLAWWNAANMVGSLPVPSLAGQSDSTHVPLGLYGQPYSFILRTRDEAMNWSGWSNVVVFTATVPDTIPPARVKNLRKK